MSTTGSVESHASIVDRIVDKLFETLDSEEVFDAATIKELRELATTNGLSKPGKVAEAIKSLSRGM
jgi:hypothetical protein